VSCHGVAPRFGRVLLGLALLVACSKGGGAPRELPPLYFDAGPVCAGEPMGLVPPPTLDAQAGADVPAPDAAAPPDGSDPFDAPAAGEPSSGSVIVPVGPGGVVAATAKVLVVSIDGLRPDAVFKAPAKQLLALACAGSYSWQARTVDPTVTIPGHASMLSGFPPEAHKIFHDDLRPGYIAVPTVMAQARRAGRRVVIVVGKEKLIQLAPPDTFDVFVWAPGGDNDVADKAIVEARAGFELMVVHFPDVDLTGHAQGWMSEPYLAQVRTTDAALGRLLEVVPPETIVIVSADHGGYGYIHWSDLPEDHYIPWIARGPGVPAGHAIAQPISTMDTAATAAQILGVKLAPGARGQPVLEALSAP
jgi:hypothetical protein